MTPEPVRIGLLGCGNVGAALVELIRTRSDDISARTGLALEVARVAVRSTTKERSVTLPEGVLTHDAAGVVTDPDIDVVVEVIGGIEPARELTLDAIKAGKPVITANKELLANVGAELFAAADGAGVDLLFEAAVAGGIPVIRPLRESLAGERINRVMGIVNGTTNYILTRMTEAGASYADALADAQSLGYAEREAGPNGGEVGVRVHPAMVPAEHPLASVRDSFNAVFVEGAAVGELMFYGRGAGGFPPASVVLGDLIDAPVNPAPGSHASIGVPGKARVRPIDEGETAY